MISEFVEYVKQVWKNKPNVSSPLNADRLNHMEAGIENNSKKIKETVTVVNELTEKSKYINVIDVGTVTSFDNIKTPGVYTGEYTGGKYGSIDNFYMLVLTSKGKYINQYITGMFSYSSANIYLRYYDNSKWTNIGKITFS